MNISQTLARKDTKQPNSIVAEKKITTAKLNIKLHTTDKRGIERNKAKRKQKGGNAKMEQDNLRKTDGSE